MWRWEVLNVGKSKSRGLSTLDQLRESMPDPIVKAAEQLNDFDSAMITLSVDGFIYTLMKSKNQRP